MPNKHFCQNPKCHENTSMGRFQKSTGRLRTKYAQHERDVNSYCELFKYFCSQGCANEFLNINMVNVLNGIPIHFNHERKLSSSCYEVEHTSTHYGGYNELKRID